MTDDPNARAELRAQIEARRAGIATFLHGARPRRNRLINVSIVSSATAAVLVGGPALAGPPFTNAIKEELSLSSPASVWQPLCLAALIVSLISAISSNLSKSHDLAAHVTAAEVCNTELEGVLTSLQFGQVSVEEAADQYQHCVSKIPFVEELPDTQRAGGAS
ncbi:hypothetical protein AB0E63_45210 [Kribbella sp. NPDC026596]|uniref:hypothetical protein n=1 Tax=Kribbella sp. NPDC026596 TaxID=3155122 RepID=UPI0033D4E1B4